MRPVRNRVAFRIPGMLHKTLPLFLAASLASFLPAVSLANTNAPLVGVAAYPIVFYSPETSAGGGGGLTLTFRKAGEATNNRPDSLSLAAMYTFRNQTMLFATPMAYFGDGDWKAGLGLGYVDFPDQFYGVGNDTSEDDEESYTRRDLKARPLLLRRVAEHLRAGAFYEWQETDIYELEEGGQLEGGSVPGVEGGTIAGAGPAIEWDTRDQLFAPTSGNWFQATAGFYREELGSDFHYDAFTLDLRHYRSAGRDRVLAFQFFATSLSGDVPFTEYARLEGLRGVVNSRFRDDNAAWFQTEYRYPIAGRLSGVAFAGFGDVFGHGQDWQPEDVKYAGGAGLRYTLNRRDRINFRLDLAVSPWGVQPYFSVMEAF